MAIETLDDIVEELADELGMHGTRRSCFVAELKERIRRAVKIENKLSGDNKPANFVNSRTTVPYDTYGCDNPYHMHYTYDEAMECLKT